MPEKETYFMYESLYAESIVYNYGKPDGAHQHIHHPDFPLGDVDVHLGGYGDGENFTSGYIINKYPDLKHKKVMLKTPFIYNNGPAASINLKVFGLSNNESPVPDHHLQVKINEALVFDNTFDGEDIQTFNLNDLPLTKLNAPQNTVEFSTATDTAYIDMIGISHLTIKYPRSFDFRSTVVEEFYLEAEEASQYLEFENLIEGHTYFLIDVTNQLKTQLTYLVGKEVHAVHLPSSKNKTRQLYLYKNNYIKNIEELETIHFTNYSEPANQGDYIIITHPQLQNELDAIQQYANYRASFIGGNYKPVIVNVEELYGLYSNGIAKHPLAIKYFLNDALANWSTKPKHCFLIGKGIENRRTKILDHWNENLVPTFGFLASDQIFGAVDYSPLSRLAIGRLSVTKPIEILNYLNKVKKVELPYTGELCQYADEQAWKHKMVHLADRDYIDSIYNPYNSRLIQQAEIAKRGNLTASSQFLFVDKNEHNTCKLNATSSDYLQIFECLKTSVEQGVKIISFLGASSSNTWSIKIRNLPNYNFNEKYPIVIGQDELAGNIYQPSSYDDDRTVSPKEWLNTADKGATAYIGFNTIWDMFAGASFVDDLYEQMFTENPQLTFGQQVNKAIHQHYNQNDIATKYATNCVSYSGDPALKYYANYQSEVILNEENVKIQIDKPNEFFYNLSIQFEMASLNIPSTQQVSYQIIQLTGSTDEVIETGFAKPNSTIYFKKDFTLLPNQYHNYTIKVDYDNTFNEICESNNQFSFEAADWLVGIDEQISSIHLKNHPNPFRAYTIFEFSGSQSNASKLEIINLKGEVVYQHQFELSSNKQSFTWYGTNQNNSQLSAGIYWYYLKDGKNDVVSIPKKIVLAR